MSQEIKKRFHATDSTLEKGFVADADPVADPVAQTNDHHPLDVSDLDGVQRRLKQRHVQMYVHRLIFFSILVTKLNDGPGLL